MALTRNYLKSMGLTDEQVNAIIENHTETVEALKKERDGYKATAETVGSVTKERDRLQADLEKARKDGSDAAKVQADFDAYRLQVETGKVNEAKRALIKSALEKAGANPAAIDLMLGTVKLEEVEMDGEALKDAEAVLKPIREAHAGLFGTVQNQGTPPLNPPGGDGKMTRESFEKLPLVKRMEYINAHPEQQKELID